MPLSGSGPAAGKIARRRASEGVVIPGQKSKEQFGRFGGPDADTCITSQGDLAARNRQRARLNAAELKRLRGAVTRAEKASIQSPDRVDLQQYLEDARRRLAEQETKAMLPESK